MRQQINMEVTRFEKELQAIDPSFRIVVNPNCTDVSGLYWNGAYLFTLPAKEIFDDQKDSYQDAVGNKHRTRTEALGMAKKFLWRLKNEPDFLETMTEPL